MKKERVDITHHKNGVVTRVKNRRIALIHKDIGLPVESEDGSPLHLLEIVKYHKAKDKAEIQSFPNNQWVFLKSRPHSLHCIVVTHLLLSATAIEALMITFTKYGSAYGNAGQAASI